MNLPILMYHELEPRGPISPYAASVLQFERQLDLLGANGFKTISFRELLEAIATGRKLSRKSVILTFDDGYQSFRELAVPALRARGMTATVFLVAGEIGGSNRWETEPDFPRRALMDEAGIRDVQAKGMELGSHGWMHRDLTACSEPQVEEELVRSRLELQRRFGVEIETFAYPYGRHAPEHFPRVACAGYRAAVSIFSDAASVTENPYAMRRVYVHEGDTTLRFRCKLSSAYLRFLAWRGIPKPRMRPIE